MGKVRNNTVSKDPIASWEGVQKLYNRSAHADLQEGEREAGLFPQD